MREPTTTEGYEAFWIFAARRHSLYLSRVNGQPVASADPVLANNRFTNAYRAADRVSQFLISEVQYAEESGWPDTFVRTLVFKLFNRISTWQHLASDLGEISLDVLELGAVDESLAKIAAGRPIYSAAYIMPPPRSLTGPKFVRHLSLLRRMVAEGAHDEIAACDRMVDAFDVLRRYESVGDFLAYQFITDLNYSSHLAFGEDEFVVPGPGARRGLRKCFSDANGMTDEELIRWTAEQQHTAFNRFGLEWEGLWGRDLQLIDVQNLFCEVDKYTRVAMPQLSRFAPGERIKQRYRKDSSAVTAWFPPKWGINSSVPAIGCTEAQMTLFSNSSIVEPHLALV
jgi:5-hmdU DNA kinase, helical domain